VAAVRITLLGGAVALSCRCAPRNTRSLNPETCNMKIETRNPKPGTRNPEHYSKTKNDEQEQNQKKINEDKTN
jgi:hypothetical protein